MDLSNPDQFFQIIPTNVVENIQFRKDLHTLVEKDPGMRKAFLQMCYDKPQIAFNACFWTYNPRNKPGRRNLPFILRPAQYEAVDSLKEAIDNGHDMLIDKSRDEGATELVSKLFALYFMVVPESSFLTGSRKEEYVDGATSLNGGRVGGSPRCIFHKILYTFATAPLWMRPQVDKKHMHIENLDNSSIIDGEATNENFGAGDRRTAILLDEFGRVDHKLAQNIRESVADVSDCVLYNSTHFYGRGHPFARLRFSNKCKVICLPWYKNPEKTHGLYKSTDLDEVEVYDERYYKDLLDISGCKRFKVSSVERELLTHSEAERFKHFKFVADGADKWRSAWYDKEVARRDPRDIAQNIDMNPAGSGDNFFDHFVLQRLRTDRVKPPKYRGEVEYTLGPKGHIVSTRWVENGGRKNFRWWGDLYRGRPRQDRNYVVACDISLGTGASNSVAKVYDTTTRECVGMHISSQLPPEEFCDHVVAICYWVGGANGTPYLTWEANGPGGSFDVRRRFHNYSFVYMDTMTRTKNLKRTKKPGWYSTKQAKYDALLALRGAIAQGMKTNPIGEYLITYDEDTVSEYEDYIFYDNGDIGLSECVDDTAGARSAHGDCVITDAIALLALRQQPRANVAYRPGNTAYSRRQSFIKQQEQDRKQSPWLR